MTRKHFESLADALKRTKPSQEDILMQRGEYNQWKDCVRAVASACLEHNGRFDRDTFYRACGYEVS